MLTLLAIFSTAITVQSQQWNPRPGWKDSFEANGFCWCDSNLDHGIANKTVTINNTAYSVVDICDELKKHPNYRAYQNGDPIYNDIQCGNGPFNDAPDEPGCPGRVDLGPEGCDQIGPKWDMAWLSSRPRFNGDGGTDGGDGGDDLGEIGTAGTGGSGQGEGPKLRVLFPTLNKRLVAPATFTVEAEATDADGVKEIQLIIDGQFVRAERFAPYLWNDRGQDNVLANLPVKNYLLEIKAYDNKGNVSVVDILVYVIPEGTDGGSNTNIAILGQSINKYVSAENGSRSMRANRNTAGVEERFTFESLGNNQYAIKGNNGKYVSSENGAKAMNCNRNAVGAWEKFVLEPLGNDLYAIKGNNGKYVSHENGKDKGIFCNRTNIGSWEKFVIQGLNNTTSRANQNLISDSKNIRLFPNPSTLDNLKLQISDATHETCTVEIIDLNGKRIASKSITIEEKGNQVITLNDLKSNITTQGLYLVKVTLGEAVFVEQMLLK